MTPHHDESRLLAARIGAELHDLEVIRARFLTPAVRRVQLRSSALATFVHKPGQDLMFTVAVDSTAIVRRRYTIRAFHPATRTVTIDILIHSRGPGARWAATAQPGDRVEAIGPRGKVHVACDADWHLFVGDESFLPAAFAMAEGLVSSAAFLVLELESAEEEPPLCGAVASA